MKNNGVGSTGRWLLAGASGVGAIFAIALAACSSTTTGPAPGTDASTKSDTSVGEPDSSTVADAGGGDTSTAVVVDAAFGVDCTENKQCQSNVCFIGGSRSFCSMHCEAGSDCPNPPTTGTCNMMGYCK